MIRVALRLIIDKEHCLSYRRDMLKLRWDIFESRDVVRLLRIPERELRYWAVLGIVRPDFGEAVGERLDQA